jgi:hypothetical protein
MADRKVASQLILDGLKRRAILVQAAPQRRRRHVHFSRQSLEFRQFARQ